MRSLHNPNPDVSPWPLQLKINCHSSYSCPWWRSHQFCFLHLFVFELRARTDRLKDRRTDGRTDGHRARSVTRAIRTAMQYKHWSCWVSENKSVLILCSRSSSSSRAPGVSTGLVNIITAAGSQASLAFHQPFDVSPHPHLSDARVLVVSHVLLLITQSLAKVLLLLNTTTVLLPASSDIHVINTFLLQLRKLTNRLIVEKLFNENCLTD